MNIEEILDDMDDLLDRSRPIPFAAHKAVIDADRMRELLNSAHLNIPAEIKRAKLIDSDCDRIIMRLAKRQRQSSRIPKQEQSGCCQNRQSSRRRKNVRWIC